LTKPERSSGRLGEEEFELELKTDHGLLDGTDRNSSTPDSIRAIREIRGQSFSEDMEAAAICSRQSPEQREKRNQGRRRETGSRDLEPNSN